MVRHTQKIRRLFSTNCLSVFDHFVRLALNWLRLCCWGWWWWCVLLLKNTSSRMFSCPLCFLLREHSEVEYFFACFTTYHLLRRSRPEVFCKKGILRSFTKFTGKHLKPATLLKKRLWHRCFPVNSVKFLRTPFYKEHLWWLLLFIHFLFLRCKNINDFLTSSWSCIVALTYFFTQ